GDVVVILGGQKRRGMEVRLLSFHHVGHIDELVVPGVLRDDRHGTGEVLHDIRHVAAGQRRDDLLHHRPERNDAYLEGVPARLLVLGDEVLEGGVFLGDETLGPPYVGGLGRRTGNVGTCERPRCRQRGRSTKQRTSAALAHPDLLAVPRAAGIASRSGALPWIIGRRLLFTGTNRRVAHDFC